MKIRMGQREREREREREIDYNVPASRPTVLSLLLSASPELLRQKVCMLQH